MTETTETEAEVQETQTEETEELILGKFKTPDDLAAAYQELESKLGSGGEEQPSESQGSPLSSLMEESNAILAEKGHTDEAWQEIAAKAKEAGVPDDWIDLHRKGVDASIQARKATILEVAGGEEKLASAVAWGNENMSEADQAAFNEAMQSNDPAAEELAVRRLVAAYEHANPVVNRPLVGRQAVPQHKGFESRDEYEAAVASSRYHSDPKYRAEVTQRFLMSPFA